MSDMDDTRKDERFDDLIRTRLGEYRVEPSPRTWRRLSRNLLWKELVRFHFTNLPWYSWVMLGTAVVLVGTVIFLVPSSTAPVATSSQPGVTVSTSHPGTGTPGPQGAASPGHQVTGTPGHRGTGAPVHQETGSPGAPIPHDRTGLQPAAAPASPQAGIQVPSGPLLAARTPSFGISLLKPFPATGFTMPLFPSGIRVKHVENPQQQDTKSKETVKPWRNGPETSLDLGLDIAPQIVFYKVPSNYFKYNYTFDLGGQLSVARFYLQTAFAFTWSADVGNYAVYYNKRDSVGYMYSVNSFTPDPEHPGEVLYQTTIQTVYDSNSYVYDYNTQTTYYYLQFPLILGYKIFKKPAWNLGVEAGGLYMLLLKHNEPNPVFYVPDTRVTDIQRESPLKETNSFGILAGVRFEYTFTKNFFLVVEPSFNYYINQVQESGALHSTQPWAIGLRTGLWYRIPFKSQK